MAILRSWFNGLNDYDIPYADIDDALGRAGELIKGCPARLGLRLEIVLDTGKVLSMQEIVEILHERAEELRDRPRVR